MYKIFDCMVCGESTPMLRSGGRLWRGWYPVCDKCWEHVKTDSEEMLRLKLKIKETNQHG